jgi:hypothetical protein
MSLIIGMLFAVDGAIGDIDDYINFFPLSID